MPLPLADETQDDFITRCIPIVIEDETAENSDQAVAICNSLWEEDSKMNTQAQEHKTLPLIVTKIDSEQGIVEHTVAVMGNIDLGEDRVHSGAFTKTITERMGKIRVLDTHNSGSVLNVIGRPLALWEVNQTELAPEVKAEFPSATGALMARTQFLMDTPEGKGAFIRIRDKAVSEYSIGYDALRVDFTKETIEGKEINVRNLREIRLWEYSPVTFAMNPATSTVSAKEADPERFTDEQEPEPERFEGEPTEQPEIEQEKDKADSPAEEAKIGRAISAANAGRIQAAIDNAQDALADLEAMLSGIMPQEDEQMDIMSIEAPAEDDKQAASGQDVDAEPVEPLTSKVTVAYIEQAMKQIQRELLEETK